MRRLMLVAIFSSLAVTAWAQTETASRFTKVYIRSTASDALVSLGGADLSGYFVIRNVDPVIDLRESDAATDEKYWGFISSNGDLIFRGINDAYSSTAEVYRVGRTGATPGPFTFNTRVLIPDGSASAPGLAFASDSDNGFYKHSSTSVALSMNSQEIIFESNKQIVMPEFDNGTGLGSGLHADRNSNASTPAPGWLGLSQSDGTMKYLWVDTSGNLRIHTTSPSSAGGVGDTAGTVVGTQTSSLTSKDLLGQIANTASAMDIIRRTPVYAFTYKNGAYNGEVFYGIVTEYSPLFGMDAGKSFNPVTAFGATVLSLQDLDARVRALEARQ